MAQRFIIGVGAQKAGTTWLHNYLVRRREVYLPRLKELHYFDAVWRKDLGEKFDERFIRRLRWLLSDMTEESVRPSDAALIQEYADRIAMIHGGERAYANFFARRLSSGITHFGEITPSYALLPVEGFRHIKRLRPDAKVVFLMRDPVQRYYSALRHWEREGKGRATDAFLPLLRGRGFVERTRYELTISRLREVFDENAIFFGFYETLFCDPEIRRLCAFLDLPFEPGNYDRVFNASPKLSELTSEQLAMAHQHYAETYAFCRREFGAAVPSSWAL